MTKKYHGFLGRNQFKTEEKHPDYAGLITIAGSEYSIGGWIGKSKQGRQILRLRVSLRKRPSIQDRIDEAKGGGTME